MIAIIRKALFKLLVKDSKQPSKRVLCSHVYRLSLTNGYNSVSYLVDLGSVLGLDNSCLLFLVVFLNASSYMPHDLFLSHPL
jgi:hypothetical protein